MIKRKVPLYWWFIFGINGAMSLWIFFFKKLKFSTKLKKRIESSEKLEKSDILVDLGVNKVKSLYIVGLFSELTKLWVFEILFLIKKLKFSGWESIFWKIVGKCDICVNLSVTKKIVSLHCSFIFRIDRALNLWSS